MDVVFGQALCCVAALLWAVFFFVPAPIRIELIKSTQDKLLDCSPFFFGKLLDLLMFFVGDRETDLFSCHFTSW